MSITPENPPTLSVEEPEQKTSRPPSRTGQSALPTVPEDARSDTVSEKVCESKKGCPAKVTPEGSLKSANSESHVSQSSSFDPTYDPDYPSVEIEIAPAEFVDESGSLLDKIKARYKGYRVCLKFCIVTFLMGCCQSLHPPFLVEQAHMLGLKHSMGYSSMYVVFDFATFIGCCCFGTQIYFWHPKYTLVSSIFVMGSTNIIFGALEWCPDAWMFIKLACLIRIIESLGRSLFITCAFGYLVFKYGTWFPSTSLFMLLFFTYGYFCGPAIGCWIYRPWGFAVPYFTFGGLLTLSVIIVKKIPKLDTQQLRTSNTHLANPTHTLKELLHEMFKYNGVISCIISIFTCASSYAFVIMAVQPHAVIFPDITGFWLGILFTAHSFFLILGATGVAYLRATMNKDYPAKCIYFTSALSLAVGIILLNHFFGHNENSLWLQLICGASFHGLGMSHMVSSYPDLIQIPIDYMFSETMETYRAGAVVWLVATTSGTVFGFLSIALLMETVGFHWASVVPFVCHLVTALVCTAIGAAEELKFCVQENTKLDYLTANRDERILPSPAISEGTPLLGTKYTHLAGTQFTTLRRSTDSITTTNSGASEVLVQVYPTYYGAPESHSSVFGKYQKLSDSDEQPATALKKYPSSSATLTSSEELAICPRQQPDEQSVESSTS